MRHGAAHKVQPGQPLASCIALGARWVPTPASQPASEPEAREKLGNKVIGAVRVVKVKTEQVPIERAPEPVTPGKERPAKNASALR